MFEIIKFMSKKRIENLDASLSLHFSNNMFQAQIIEFLEKNSIKYIGWKGLIKDRNLIRKVFQGVKIL